MLELMTPTTAAKTGIGALLLAGKDLISNNIKLFNFPKTHFVKVHLWIFSLPLSYSCASAPGCVHKTTHGASSFELVIRIGLG